MTHSGERSDSSQPTAKTPSAGNGDSQKPLESRILRTGGIWLLVGLVHIGGFAGKHDADQKQAQADAEEARVTEYCKQVWNKMESFYTAGGIADGGKEWAAETLRTVPPELESECSFTHFQLERLVDGTAERNIAGNAAWDCYDKGHADGAWRPHGGTSIGEWEDQLAASCGVQGSLPQEKSAVSR